MRTLLQRLTHGLRAIENRLTVRTQIASAVAAMAIVLVGSLAAGAAFVSYRDTASLVNSRLATVAAATAERLDHAMAMRQREIHLFTKLEALQTLWQGDPAALRRSLEQWQASSADFAWIGFARPDGIVVASTGGLLQGRSVVGRSWFDNGLHGISVNDVHEFDMLSSLLAPRRDGEAHRFVDIAVPVQDAAGVVIGVLGGHLNWDWARHLIANAEANDGGTDTTLSIVSKDGVVLLGPGMHSQKYSGDQLAAILDRRAGAFSEMATDSLMMTAFHVSHGHDGYQGLNWIVTASQPASAIMAVAARSAKTILVIGAMAGLAGAVLAFSIARRISRPIHQITLEADRIGRAAGPVMLQRQNGSLEVVQLTRALRALLRRIGFAEEQAKEVEQRATETALQFNDDLTRLKRLADTDHLTGLMNRRAFLAMADDAMRLSQRYGHGLATLMIDIDHFKRINDVHGHLAGDCVIKRVAEIIDGGISATDRAARFGGEEFVVLLRGVDEEKARLIADRIRLAIQQVAIDYATTPIPVTASIGVAVLAADDRDVQDMIERADQGLYAAKNAGRNRICFMSVAESRAAHAA